MHAHMCVHKDARTHACSCACMHVCTHTCACTYLCVHAPTRTRMVAPHAHLHHVHPPACPAHHPHPCTRRGPVCKHPPPRCCAHGSCCPSHARALTPACKQQPAVHTPVLTPQHLHIHTHTCDSSAHTDTCTDPTAPPQPFESPSKLPLLLNSSSPGSTNQYSSPPPPPSLLAPGPLATHLPPSAHLLCTGEGTGTPYPKVGAGGLCHLPAGSIAAGLMQPSLPTRWVMAPTEVSSNPALGWRALLLPPSPPTVAAEQGTISGQ